MKPPKLFLTLLVLLFAACHTPRQISDIQRTRILVDARYDTRPDSLAQAFIAPYKHRVDSIMSPVVGTIDHYMAAHKPESDLSNLLADIMVWGGRHFGEQPDFGVYNMGGIRAAFAKGDVTYGDVLNVAPFENHICFLTLTGDCVLQLFREMAEVGGEGVSHSVRLVMTRDGKLDSATVSGRPVVPARKYRVATLDYLAQGNDNLSAFKSKTEVLSPQDEKYAVRHIIVDYFKSFADQGLVVTAKTEGRITVK